MINPAKLSVGVFVSCIWELSSYYQYKPSNDRRHARDFMDADYLCGEVLLLGFLNGLHPQTLTFFSLSLSFWENFK